MALAKDLMQVGIPDQAATRLGYTIGGVNAAGTTQGTAAAIPASATLVTIASGANNSGVILSANVELGADIVVANGTLNTIILYPPSGGNFNINGVSLAIPSKAAAHVTRASVSAWVAVLGAAAT
jgi:hypothetical protein